MEENQDYIITVKDLHEAMENYQPAITGDTVKLLAIDAAKTVYEEMSKNSVNKTDCVISKNSIKNRLNFVIVCCVVSVFFTNPTLGKKIVDLAIQKYMG